MTYQLTWMPDVLLKAGLKVAECEGWRERGRADMGRVRGVMVHHTGTNKGGNMPTLRVLIEGRPDLLGPLANLGLGLDGTYYVVAAGRSNHAGPGEFRGIKTGNSSFIGIEAENGGGTDDAWPEIQMEAYRRGVAALLSALDAPVDMCVAHREWARPLGRKIDPRFDMSEFRSAVLRYWGEPVPLPCIPKIDAQGEPTLRRASKGDVVERLQMLLDLRADGVFGARTEAALRDWQGRHGLTADGICGPKTWAVIRSVETANVPPAPASAADGMDLSKDGVRFIHAFEGCAKQRPDGRFEAYPDPGSQTGRPWTIGWGSTGAGIAKGTIWTQEECDGHFGQCIRRYVADVNRALAGAPTTQNQFDALVSFHYNTGAIAKATLTRLHNEGEHDRARKEFGRWTRNDGRVMAGLVRRRQEEAALYARD